MSLNFFKIVLTEEKTHQNLIIYNKLPVHKKIFNSEMVRWGALVDMD
jgi:hypothetical protein